MLKVKLIIDVKEFKDFDEFILKWVYDVKHSQLLLLTY